MTYKTDDGEVIQGASPLDIVTALRDGGRFTADQNIDDFMDGFADRLWEYSQLQVDPASTDVFVADLIRVGYLTALS